MKAETQAQPGTPTEPNPDALLSVRGLVKNFPLTQGVLFKTHVGDVQAVSGVAFDLHKGETLGLVGESGCGKSTVARVLLRLHEPTAGQAYFKGRDVFSLSRRDLRQLRRDIQIIFQDPYSSLNPRMTVGDIVAEPWAIHRDVASRRERRTRAQDLLALRGEALRRKRREIQVVFQDPWGSLNPRMRIGTALREPLVVHRLRRSPRGATSGWMSKGSPMMSPTVIRGLSEEYGSLKTIWMFRRIARNALPLTV